MDDAHKRNAAYAASHNGRCPECERSTVISTVKISTGPDQVKVLKDAFCAALDCEWRWP